MGTIEPSFRGPVSGTEITDIPVKEKAPDYLTGKDVYLAGPMFACKDDGVGWRDLITPRLINDYGLHVEDPTKKTADGLGEVGDDKALFKKLIAKKQFKIVREKFWPIVRKDLRCVDKADFLILLYDPNVHMFGTIHEWVAAHSQKKPILMKYNEEHLDTFNVWATTLVKPEWMFTEWDDMFDYLDLVRDGFIDRKYWTL